MSWFNSLRFSAKKKKPFVEPKVKELVLYCDNPRCESPIRDMEIAYSEEKREIYHVGGCFALANDDSGFSFAYSEVANLGHVRTEEALKLLVKGGLKQSELEEKFL